MRIPQLLILKARWQMWRSTTRGIIDHGQTSTRRSPSQASPSRLSMIMQALYPKGSCPQLFWTAINANSSYIIVILRLSTLGSMRRAMRTPLRTLSFSLTSPPSSGSHSTPAYLNLGNRWSWLRRVGTSIYLILWLTSLRSIGSRYIRVSLSAVYTLNLS